MAVRDNTLLKLDIESLRTSVNKIEKKHIGYDKDFIFSKIISEATKRRDEVSQRMILEANARF